MVDPLRPTSLVGARVLVTGATGRVAGPIARTLAETNVVYGLARFTDPNGPARLEADGVIPVPADLGRVDVTTLPDVDYVFHAGAALGSDATDWR